MHEEELSPRCLSENLLLQLQQAGATLCAAESMTGGWFSKSLVDIPGASAVFCGGVVSYTDAIKAHLLSVPEDMLARYTAVSAPVARAMAEGARAACGTTLAVSVTGYADTAPQEEARGLVYIACAGPQGTTVQELHLTGDRMAVRASAVREMHHLVQQYLADLT